MAGSKSLDVGLPGEQKLPETEVPISERLGNAEQYEVVFYPLFAEGRAYSLSECYESLDRIFSINIVPRHPS